MNQSEESKSELQQDEILLDPFSFGRAPIKEEEKTESEEHEDLCEEPDGEESHSQPVQKKRNKALLVLSGVLLIVVLFGTGIFFLRNGKQVKVPELQNMETAEAKQLLEKNQLELGEIKEEFSEEIEEGKIISQEVKAGEKTEKGSRILVTVSKGSQFTVPDLKYLTMEEAKNQMERWNLSVEIAEEQYSDTVEKGSIIDQLTKAGEEMHGGQNIRVIVSKGPESVEVPDVTGKTEEEAGALLKSVELDYEVEKAFDDSVEKGKIISQEPKAKDSSAKGSTIKITISKGIEKVEVPDVIGLKEKKAKEELKRAGLEIETSEEFSDSTAKGYVVSQDIDAEEKIKKGSTISIVISKGRDESKKTSTTSSGSQTSSSGSSGSSVPAAPATPAQTPAPAPAAPQESGGEDIGDWGGSGGDTGGGEDINDWGGSGGDTGGGEDINDW